MSRIDSAFDDAYRSCRIQAGVDARTLPNPYARSVHGAKDTGEGGGFMADDEPSPTGGGFVMESDDEEPTASAPTTVRPASLPLSFIPDALTNLGLDATDAHVLSIFADTAYTPASARGNRRDKPEKVVNREEFRQVVTVLLDQQKNDGDEAADASADLSVGSRRPKRKAAIKARVKANVVQQEEPELEDTNGLAAGGGFIVEDPMDEDDGDSADDFGATAKKQRRGSASDSGEDAPAPTASRRRQRVRASRSSPVSSDEGDDLDDDDEEDDEADSDLNATPSKKQRAKKGKGRAVVRSTSYLNPQQREKALAEYEMMLKRAPTSKTSLTSAQRRLGVAEIKYILQSLNMTIPEKEIEEMVQEGSRLFAPASSNQQDDESADQEKRKSVQAIRGLDSAQGIQGPSIGLDEFAGIMVYNRTL